MGDLGRRTDYGRRFDPPSLAPIDGSATMRAWRRLLGPAFYRVDGASDLPSSR